MNMKKTALAAALSVGIGIPATASADIITMTFDGLFTLIGATNAINANADASSNIYDGNRTEVTGSASFDTATGSGSATIAAFSFFGGGLAEATNILFQAIGDGNCTSTGCGPGTLVAGQMGFNWNGTFGIPVTLVLDASGFFANVPAPGATVTIDRDSGGTFNSATRNLPSSYGTNRSIGTAPMAMTTLNTTGTTLGSIFPLFTDASVGNVAVAGSPMTTLPFPGQNAAFDFMQIVATNTSVIPVPAAVWLFGSGLLGLVGVARRRKTS